MRTSDKDCIFPHPVDCMAMFNLVNDGKTFQKDNVMHFNLLCMDFMEYISTQFSVVTISLIS